MLSEELVFGSSNQFEMPAILPTQNQVVLSVHSRSEGCPYLTDGVGTDDRAFRKGVDHGTAIVDLKLHKVVDLLPDKETATLENWLKNHPEISAVTRDRFNRYALAYRTAYRMLYRKLTAGEIGPHNLAFKHDSSPQSIESMLIEVIILINS